MCTLGSVSIKVARIYLRVSTEDQDLTRQAEICLRSMLRCIPEYVVAANLDFTGSCRLVPPEVV
jgi:hypothetical protein